MESILTLAKTEGMLFKGGSGTGTNLSTLRSSREVIKGGGLAAGPVEFMRGFDAFAGVIKSGGKSRRAAKMVILNVDHPDIVEFIRCKADEERKAHALIDIGYEASWIGEAYRSISFQHSNNSVRVSDEFMKAVEEDRSHRTRKVTTGEVVQTLPARELWRMIAESAWRCGDPGVQFDTTINAWHTSPASGRINASNPCSEYMYLDDSACNLASLNLCKFDDGQGEFDVQSFRKAIEISILAQEIIVESASYPTERIAENSRAFRPLGLGFANLGALLMSRGLPYDSDGGRAYAAAISALMCGHAYAVSARIARDAGGPFTGYSMNREPFLAVIEKHRAEVDKIDSALVSDSLAQAAREAWDEALTLGKVHGYRNGQVTVLAPTGTIAFMMDCDTTGIEPDIALVKYKALVSGGVLKIVNRTVGRALVSLGYCASESDAIVDYLDVHETIEGAPGLKPDHLAVFDCAFRSRAGTRSISPLGHVRMMAACQPFLSGAISKTVNLPSEASIEDIEEVYLSGWRLGLKSIAVYRDGCKRSQPLSTSSPAASSEELLRRMAAKIKPRGAPVAIRRKLPEERPAVIHRFSIAGHDGYLTVGMYDDGSPGELFIHMAKEGSTIAGLMDSLGTVVALALQYGVPLGVLCEKLAWTRFEPAGFTGNPALPHATSAVDYIFRWLQAKFLQGVEIHDPRQSSPPESVPAMALPEGTPGPWIDQADAQICYLCGSIMVRSGACHRCLCCGATSGCS